MSKKDEAPEEFYETIYGISRLSPRYWWRRRSQHRIAFSLLFLIAVASPFGLAIWWPTLKPWIAGKYHAHRSQRYLNSGIAFLEKGDAPSGRLQLQNALRHDPSNRESMTQYARILRELKHSGYSMWAFQAYLQDPSDASVASLALGYSMEERQREIGDYIARDALRRHPKDAPLRVLAAHQFVQLGNTAAALRVARQAKEIAPQNQEAAFLVASLSARNTDLKLAEHALAELRSFRDKPAYRSRANWALVNAMANSSPEAAIEILDELAADKKSAWRAHLRRAIISNRLNPTQTPATLSKLWTDAKDAAQRRGVLETAEILSPNMAQPFLDSLNGEERRSLPMLFCQFRIWARSGSWRRIADLANDLAQTENADDRVMITLWLARANRQLKQSNAERTCIRVAATRCESNPALAMRAAMLLERFGMSDAAIEFYGLVSAKSPGQFATFAASRTAAIERSAGRTPKMLAAWEDALRKNPRDSQSMNNVAAGLLMTGGDLQRALKLSSEALATRPRSPYFGDTYALALAKAGRTKEALAIHEKLPSQRLQDPEFILNYATVLYLAGLKTEAMAVVSNMNTAGLMPDQVAELRKISGAAKAESPLLELGKPASGPSIPSLEPHAIGPMPDGPEIPGESPLDLMTPPSAGYPEVR